MSTIDIVDAEIIPSTAVEVVDYRPTFALTPEALADQILRLKEVTKSVLVSGVDYMRIPGTPKPSLLKPGAERLLQLYGFGHKMIQGAVDREDGRQFGVEYTCVVTRSMSDGREVTVSSCDGYAGRDEAKWKAAPWNTIMKMAQKRALVGAALTATAASGLFTQDLEDYTEPAAKAIDRPVERGRMEKSRDEYVSRAREDVADGAFLARTGALKHAMGKLSGDGYKALRDFCREKKIPVAVTQMSGDQMSEVEGYLVMLADESEAEHDTARAQVEAGYQSVQDVEPGPAG